MLNISNFYDKAKEKNIYSGIIIVDLITFISYLIFPSGLIFFGDLQMIIGSIIGTRFSLKNIKSNQLFIKNGVIVGVGGTILSAISMSLFDWTIFSVTTGFSLILLLMIMGLFLIEALVIGLSIGFLCGFYFYRKNKRKILESKIDEDFYKSLE